MLPRQSWVVATEIEQSTKPKMFTTWPFIGKSCQPLGLSQVIRARSPGFTSQVCFSALAAGWVTEAPHLHFSFLVNKMETRKRTYIIGLLWKCTTLRPVPGSSCGEELNCWVLLLWQPSACIPLSSLSKDGQLSLLFPIFPS